MTLEEKKELLLLLEQKAILKGRRSLLDFTKYTFQSFTYNWFHERYYDKLTEFAQGKIKKLMIFMPPQHGKSEGSTRRLPCFLIGDNPERKIAITSYSADKARKFNREIQRILTSDEYKRIFPQIKLSNGSDGYSLTMDEIEIVNHRGGIKTVGVGGALTGEPVDVLIIDDIYKDAQSAWSETKRDNVQDWFNSVADSRLHNDSQMLIVFTRWHEKDLAGYLLNKEPEAWEVMIYPAIKEGEPNEYDPRQEGEALWPEKHNVEKLLAIKQRDSHIFGNLYQQNPKPKEGLLYREFRTYETCPENGKKKAVIDTADEGADYLCCIIYTPTTGGYYVNDVLYTKKPMEETENATAQLLTKHGVSDCRIESNNGGRSFARNVERICRSLGNRRTSFEWFHQKHNKQVRIFTKSAEVQNMIYMPKGWDYLFPEFHSDVTGYMAAGKNKNDDAPDALTMVIEYETVKRFFATAQ